jgi:hypothetical protein
VIPQPGIRQAHGSFSPGDGTAVGRGFARSYPSTAGEEGKERKGKEGTRSLPLSDYTTPRACGKARVVVQHRLQMLEPNGRQEMRVVSSTYGSSADVEPKVGLAELLSVGVPLTTTGAWR